MPKFRSKPGTITAERFHVDKAHDPKGVCRGGESCEEPTLPYNNWPHLHTMHGPGYSVQLADGDWIVLEPDGVHFYPIKDDVMKANWEQISDHWLCSNCQQVFDQETEWCPFCKIVRLCGLCRLYHEERCASNPLNMEHECDGTNCPARAHDHKVLI